MNKSLVLTLLAVMLCAGCVHGGCDEPDKTSDDGEVKAWFKNIGCKIQKGAEDLQESAKPWADKIGTSAKEFGSSVAQKYDEIKHKLTDDTSTPTPTSYMHNAPTEKVPLAPLHSASYGSDAAAGAAAATADATIAGGSAPIPASAPQPVAAAA